MFSIAPNSHRGTKYALRYFRADICNYYTGEKASNGKIAWFGNLVSEFIPDNETTPTCETLSAILDGMNPKEGKPFLRCKDKSRIATHSYVCSAPKSVSIMAIAEELVGKTDVKDAHNEAVLETLEYMQKHFSYYKKRLQKKGAIKNQKSEGLLGLLVTHDMSREFDPNLHTHIELINVTKSEDKYYALYNRYITKAEPLLTAMYRNKLAHKLRNLKYPIEFKEVRRTNGRGFTNCPKIKGLSEELCEELSQRNQTILHHAERLQAEARNKGKTIKITPRLLSNIARKYRPTKPNAHMQSLMRKNKIEEHKDEFSSVLKLRKFFKQSPESCNFEECVRSAAAQAFGKNIEIPKSELYALAMDKVAGRKTCEEIFHAVDSYLRNKNIFNKDNKLINVKRKELFDQRVNAIGKNNIQLNPSQDLSQAIKGA